MNIPTDILFELLRSVGLMTLLAASFGAIRRNLPSPTLAPVILGLLFGVAAMLEIGRSTMVFQGVLVDLRNVPILLAGAFLGWRGLALTLALAIGMRIHVGGISVSAGIAGMLISGAVGLGWARLTENRGQRGSMAFVLLALGALLSNLSWLLLPSAPRIWYLTNVTPIQSAIGMIIIPLISALLEHELTAIRREAELSRGMRFDPDTGLLMRACFMDELDAAAAAREVRLGAVMTIRLHTRFRSFDPANDHEKVQAMRLARLGHLLRDWIHQTNTIARVAPDTIALLLTSAEASHSDGLTVAIHRSIIEEFAGSGLASTNLSVELSLIRGKNVEATRSKALRYFRRTNVNSARFRALAKAKLLRRLRTKATAPLQHQTDAVSDNTVNDMFAQADYLIASRRQAG